jgi:aminopeptidase N
VTIHEFGHQYWYGIVGNNETVDAWLDEGFNSYSESRVQDVTYGHNHESVTVFNFPVVLEEVEIPFKWAAAPRYRSRARVVPLDVPSYLKPRFAYGGNAYSKAELMHWTLEGFLGWETYKEVLSTYYDRWKFRHPVSEDFFEIVNETSGMDMTWFFDQLYHGAGVIDYAVEEVFSGSREEVRGSTVRPDTAPEGGPEWTATAAQADQMERITQVTISRLGDVTFPIEVLVQFDDSRQIIERWDGVDLRHTFTYEGESRIEKIVVDPRQIVVLDINRSNNSWISTSDHRGALKLALRWFFWMQSVLEFFAFIS